MSYASIRSLARGLRVLQYLNTVTEATPVEIGQKLDLPRPTVHRILDTLIERGWVYQSRSTAAFRLTSEVRRLDQIPASTTSIEALARPVLERMTEEIAWPSALALHDRGAMVICGSTRRASALSDAGIIGHRRPMLDSALGRAYLSHCPEAERHDILDNLKASPEGQSHDDTYIAEFLEAGSRVGVSTCIEPIGPGTAAIAAPIKFGAGVLACIDIVWLADAMPFPEAVARLTPHLLAARDQIQEKLEASGPPVLPILQ